MDHVEAYLGGDVVTPRDQIGGNREDFDFEAHGVVVQDRALHPDRIHTRVFPWGIVREVRISTTG